MITECKKLERTNIEIKFFETEESNELLLRKVIARNLLSSWEDRMLFLSSSIRPPSTSPFLINKK